MSGPEELPRFSLGEPLRWNCPAIDWDNARLLLAPMVRSSSVPMRITAAQYGADAVYSEVVIDQRLARCVRVDDPPLNVSPGSVPYDSWRAACREMLISSGQTVKSVDTPSAQPRGCLRCIRLMHPEAVLQGPPYAGEALILTEKDVPLVVQLGSSNPELAASVARRLVGLCSAVDLNTGCCHGFAVKSGIGACLLKTPETIFAVLRAIRGALPIEMDTTCKTRLLETDDETVSLLTGMVDCGVRAIAVHARTPAEMRATPPQWERLGRLLRGPIREWSASNARRCGVPLPDRCDIVISSQGARCTFICNGGIWTAHDMARCRAESACQCLMLAQAAVQNLSVFAPPLSGAAAPPPPPAGSPPLSGGVHAHAAHHAGLSAPPLLFVRRAVVNAIATETPLRNTRFNLVGVFCGSPFKGRINKAMGTAPDYASICELFWLPPPDSFTENGYREQLELLTKEESAFRIAARVGLRSLAEVGCMPSKSPIDEESMQLINSRVVRPYESHPEQLSGPELEVLRSLSDESRRVVEYALIEEYCIYDVALREMRLNARPAEPGCPRPPNETESA